MKRFRSALLASVLTFGLAQPAQADPISIAVGVGAALGFGAAGATTALAIGLGVAVAGFSYLSKALIPGVKTAVTASSLTLQSGAEVPQKFPFGYSGEAGSLVYANVWGKDGKTPNAYAVKVVAISDIPMGPLLSLWDGEQACSYGTGTLDSQMGWSIPEYDKDGKHYLWVKFYDGTQTTADPYLLAKFGSDSHHPYDAGRIGTGRAYAIITARRNTDVFKSGFPELLFVSNGAKFYDQRQDSTAGGSGSQRYATPSTWGQTLNPQVIRSHIRRGIYYGGQWMFGLQNVGASRLPFDNWSAAMNDCDTEIEETPGVFVPQYRCGGIISCDVEPASADESLMRACNARHIDIGGVYKTTTGAIGAAVLSITDDDIIITEEQNYDPYVGIGDTINGVSSSYPNPEEGWKTKVAPVYKIAALIAHDGRESIADVKYECVPFPGQVQRLQKSALDEERRWRKHTIVLPHTVAASGVESGDCLTWISNRNGYDNKKFRIEAMTKLANLDWLTDIREVYPADYDWNPANDYEPVVIGSISKIVVPEQAVDGLIITAPEDGIAGEDGSRLPAIKFQWTVEDIDDVVGLNYQIRKSSDGSVVADRRAPNFSTGFVVHSEGLSGETSYECRAQYQPGTARPCAWSAWYTVTTPESKVGNGAVGWDALDTDTKAAMAAAAASVTGIRDDMLASVQNIVDAAGKLGLQAQQLKTTLVAQSGALRASFTQQITAVVTDVVALAQSYAEVSAALGDKVEASVFTAYQAVVDADLAAKAIAITGVTSRTDNFWAQGLILMSAVSNPTEYAAQVQISVAGGSAGSPAAIAAMFIGVNNVGGTWLSYVDLVADRVRCLNSLGNTLALLTSAGFWVGDRIFPGTISNRSNYSLVGGTLALSTPDTTAAPTDGSETSVASGNSIFAYDDSKSDTISVGGFTADPAAQIFDVEGFFYFRCQAGGPSTHKACIEYYDGSWHFLPGSTAVIFTSNTDALATLTPKGSIPFGATYWRPRLFNNTGNYIHVREARGNVSNFSK